MLAIIPCNDVCLPNVYSVRKTKHFFITVFASYSLTPTICFSAYRSGSKELLLSRIINFVYSRNKTPLKRKGLDFQKSLRELDSQILSDFKAAGNLESLKKKKKNEVKKSKQAEILLFHKNMKNGQKKTSCGYSYKELKKNT